MSFWCYIFITIGISLSPTLGMAQIEVGHEDESISINALGYDTNVETEQQNTRHTLAAVCKPIALGVKNLILCNQSQSSISRSTEDTMTDVQRAACASIPSNRNRFSSANINGILNDLNVRSISRFVNIGYRLQSLMDVSSAVRQSAGLSNSTPGKIRDALNNCSLSAVAGVTTHLDEASSIESDQDGDMACDLGRCRGLRQNFFHQVSSIVGLDQSREWNLAQINDHIESRSKVNCFKSKKELLLAQMVSEGYSNDLSDEQRKLARRLTLERQLAVFPSTSGVCNSENSRQGFKDLVSNFVVRGGDSANSMSFFSSNIDSVRDSSISLPSATSPFFSAFKFSPILYHQLMSSSVSNPSMSVRDCEVTVRTLSNIKTFYNSSLEALKTTGDGARFQAFVRAHETLDQSTNADAGAINSIADSLIRECNNFKLSLLATNCSSNRALLSAPSFVQEILQVNSEAGSDQLRMESICISQQQSGESPVFRGAGNLLTQIVSNNSQLPADLLDNNHAAKERYCPGFEDFVQSNSNRFCSGMSVEECFQNMSNVTRNELREAYFASRSDGVRLRQLHGGLESAARLSNAIDPQASSQLVRETNSRVGGRYPNHPEFRQYAAALGSVASVAETTVRVTNGFISASVAGAFAAQSKVSSTTVAALTNRFIAAAPQIDISSLESRNQVEQALGRAVNETVSDLESRAASTTDSRERQQYLDEIAELRRMLNDQNSKNDLISQQIAALGQPAAVEEAAPKRKREPASVASAAPEVAPEGVSSGFQSGGGRSSGGSQATSGNLGGGQDLAGAEGFGGGAGAARSVSSVSEARDAAPSDSSMRLVVGGQGGQEIPASQVVTITVASNDEQALKEAIMGQRSKLNIGEDGYAVVEVIDAATGRATLVRVKIDADNVIVQNFTAEQLRNTTIVSESNPEPRQIRYSLQAMTNLLNQASGGSN